MLPKARGLRWPALLAVLLLAGCTTSKTTTAAHPRRPFDFEHDTFSYANELVWEYRFDEQGKWTHRPREPKPDYTHHCFVVARSAKQFFNHARFDPAQPKTDSPTYRRLIRKAVSTSPRKELPDDQRIVIPGYANLREFSADQEQLLKAECGGAWQSYFQRGHWRMIWPFSRRGQANMAERLAASIKQNRPPVVHLVRFPSLKINHAVVVFDAIETDKEIRFAAYDPNAPDKPTILTYDRTNRTFSLPTNLYFPGGRVDVYESYEGHYRLRKQLTTSCSTQRWRSHRHRFGSPVRCHSPVPCWCRCQWPPQTGRCHR